MKLAKPDWLNPGDPWVNQGEAHAPIINQIEGKVFGTHRKRLDVTPASIIGRAGVMAVEGEGAADNIRHMFSHADSWAYLGKSHYSQYTQADMIAVANALPLVAMEGNDFGEGLATLSFPPDSQQAIWYYTRRLERYAAAGLIRRDWGHHGNTATYQGKNWYDTSGGQISPNSPLFRNLYQSVQAARGSCGYFSNGLESVVGVNIKNYAETADYASSYFYKRHAMEIMAKGMGKTVGQAGGPNFLIYNDWGKIEGIGDGNNGSLHNGILWDRRTVSPPGKVTTGAHSQVDYDWEVACILILGFLYGDGYCPFEHSQFGVDPNKMAAVNVLGPGNPNQIPVTWTPEVPGTPAPVSTDGYPVEPNRWLDAGYEASYFYSQMNRTAGERWQPAAYRFEGSLEWIEPPADGASTLEHAAAFDGATPGTVVAGGRRGRPTVDYRYKNDALDAVAFDSSRSKMYHEKIFIRKPNGIDAFPSTLQGCLPNVHRETIS